MAIPGCTTGSHSQESNRAAPVLSEAQEKVRAAAATDSTPVPIPKPAPVAAPSSQTLFPPRPSKGTTSTQAKAAPQTNGTPFPVNQEIEQDSADAVPADGARCKRLGCAVNFENGLQREAEECSFHPGVPIFHEGYAYFVAKDVGCLSMSV